MKHLLIITAALGFTSLVGCGSSLSTSKPLSGTSVDNGAGIASVLQIDIRKGIEIQGEFASITAPSGSVLASLTCASSTSVDFTRISCHQDGFDLEVGHIVTMPGLRGTLKANGTSYNVTCSHVAPAPNGVDGPVLEYTCHAQPQASGPGA